MLIAFAFFFATFIQSSVGFGLALAAMPILVALLGIKTAAPLVAIVGIIVETGILIRYREAFQLRAISHLTLAAIVGIPFGVYALSHLDERFVTTVLGVVLIGYSIYSFLSPTLPQLAHRGWSYGFGFIAGLLGGAYNTSGPPVIIYADCRRWPPDEFKSNLQGFFIVLGIFVIAAHALGGNLTPAVWESMLPAIPGALLGTLAGFYFSRYINPKLFHKIVLILLILLGIRLIFG